MLGLLRSYFTDISFDTVVGASKQNKPNYIYRDVLDKKASPSPSPSPSPSKLDKKRGQGEAKLREIQREEEEDGKKSIDERGGLKVKILMTKEEAARLLSKCKDGGVLEFKDVARELIQIPTSRVSVVVSSTSSTCTSIDRNQLESISEEA